MKYSLQTITMTTNFTGSENYSFYQMAENSTIGIRPERVMNEYITTPNVHLDFNSSYIGTVMNCSDGDDCRLVDGLTDRGSTFSCNDWQDAQHSLFQLANLCLIISFLTPSSFRHHAFFLRLIVSFGYLFFGLWAGLFVCMPDFIGWNLGFFTVNLIYLVYLGYKMCPTRLGHFTEELYEHTFKPLNVDRKRFKELTSIGDTYLLTKGTVYATEGKTKCGNKISILLKGR